MAVIIHILASYALWFILTQAKFPIGALRDRLMRDNETFAHFILCPMCSGFWCSWCLAAITGPFVPAVSGLGFVVGVAVKTLVGAAGVFLIEIVADRIQAR